LENITCETIPEPFLNRTKLLILQSSLKLRNWIQYGIWNRSFKPVTDGQVFDDKFLCDKFYLPSARVYTAISIKVVHEQSGKVEYERERLLGIALKLH
jgi:hypothetical protein